MKMMKKNMKGFFKNNIQQGMEMQTVWNASKEFFRGVAIKCNAIRNAQNSKRLEEIFQKLKAEEEASFQSPFEEIKWKIKRTQHEIKKLQMEEMEKQIKLAKQNANIILKMPTRLADDWHIK